MYLDKADQPEKCDDNVPELAPENPGGFSPFNGNIPGRFPVRGRRDTEQEISFLRTFSAVFRVQD